MQIFEIREARCQARATFETYAEAFDYVQATFDLVHFEADPDYPGCADFYTRNGTCWAIEMRTYTA